jgi:hypothetical protein
VDKRAIAGSVQELLALSAYPRRHVIRRQERLMRSIILVLAALLVSAIPAKADCPAGRVSSCYRLGGKIVCGCCPAGTAYSCQPIFGGKMFCGCH